MIQWTAKITHIEYLLHQPHFYAVVKTGWIFVKCAHKKKIKVTGNISNTIFTRFNEKCLCPWMKIFDIHLELTLSFPSNSTKIPLVSRLSWFLHFTWQINEQTYI